MIFFSFFFFLAWFKAALKIFPAVVQTLKVLSFYIATDTCILRSPGNSELRLDREAPTSNLVHNFSRAQSDPRRARGPAECPHGRGREGVVRKPERKNGSRGLLGNENELRNAATPNPGPRHAKTEVPCSTMRQPRGPFSQGK